MATTKAITEGSGALDWLKWLVVWALAVAAVVGNWYYQDEWSLLVRAATLVALAAVAGFVAVQTERGQRVWVLMREARMELRRVVRPTRAQTTQTTAIVLAMILVFSVILWGLDSALSYFVRLVIG